jgi:mRNA interferase RelE/StbE
LAWTVRYEARALKELRHIHHSDQKRILDYLDEHVVARQHPRGTGKPLSGTLSGLWSYRVGVYRAITRLDDAAAVALVLHLAHRREVYER